ncbi:MAG: calcium-binding protein, partial [Planctomycetes bacterium]|nr:calcium-binding protein [Planctomycetota bacterium]
GGDGDDYVNGQGGSNDTVRGGPGNDYLRGGPGNDVLYEEGDVDFDLNDDALLGQGADRLREIERAELHGGAAANTIDASDFSGSTTLHGGDGDDSLIGGRQRDRIHGEGGNDTTRGGPGDDLLYGGDGDDDLFGDEGHDQIRGGRGADDLDGGDGDDELHGEDDDDVLRGGPGDDYLDGSDGSDLLDGDDGADFEERGFAADLDEKLVVPLTPAVGSNAVGYIEFEWNQAAGAKIEMEITVSGATPGTHDVSIDGVVIGQITVNAQGVGHVKFTNRPDSPDEMPFPQNTPQIHSGTLVEIASVGSGTFESLNAGGGQQPGGQESKLKAMLSGDTAAWGKAEFETENEGQQQEQKFEVEIYNATPGNQYNVLVDGVVVGQMTINAQGIGKLEFQTQPEGDELPFPQNFPNVQSGSTVEVQGLANGTLIPDGSSNHQHQQGGDHGEMQLRANLTGNTNAWGQAEFEQEYEHGQNVRKFEVEVYGAQPGARFDVVVDGVTVGQLTIRNNGQGRLKLTTNPDDPYESPFPTNFPAVQAGSVVTVQGLVTGTLTNVPHGD